MNIDRRRLLVAAASLMAAPAIVRAQGQQGVALVIGNSKYKWEASLPNVKRDAPDIARAFQALGLQTELVQDVGNEAMRRAVDKFTAAARGANLAAFYFAGHGAAWDKETYLAPADADLANPATVSALLPVTAMRDAMKDASHRLLAFDNCRNNPADGWRQRETLIASRMTQAEIASTALHGPNTLVLFSTAPGRIAVDGPPGENSPFAAMFLRQLAGATINLQELPARLRRDLLIATEGRQLLWDQTTFDRPFVISNRSGRAATINGLPARGDLQIVTLDKAYAFAKEKGLSLPAGLVAVRSAGNSQDSEKIGSFQTTMKVMVGSVMSYGNTTIEPLLLIVVAQPTPTSAEIVFSTKDWWSTGEGANGKIWRYSTATVAGRALDFPFLRSTGGMAEMSQNFKWKDANSGTYSGRPSLGYTHTSSFTRLDG